MGQKTLIIYESTHHGNTRKLVDAIAEAFPVDTAEISEAVKMDLNAYDRIGLASGIAFAKFYPDMEAFANERLPEGKFFSSIPAGRIRGVMRHISEKLWKEKGVRYWAFMGVRALIPMDRFGWWEAFPRDILQRRKFRKPWIFTALWESERQE